MCHLTTRVILCQKGLKIIFYVKVREHKTMSYIPKNLNNEFLCDDEIRNYYSLTLTDDFFEQRIDKIIAEYMDGNKQFKTKIGEGKSASNAKRSFKKRLKGFIKNPPKKSSVYN